MVGFSVQSFTQPAQIRPLPTTFRVALCDWHVLKHSFGVSENRFCRATREGPHADKDPAASVGMGVVRCRLSVLNAGALVSERSLAEGEADLDL